MSRRIPRCLRRLDPPRARADRDLSCYGGDTNLTVLMANKFQMKTVVSAKTESNITIPTQFIRAYRSMNPKEREKFLALLATCPDGSCIVIAPPKGKR